MTQAATQWFRWHVLSPATDTGPGLLEIVDVRLAGSTKLGIRRDFILCPLFGVDVLITNSEADPQTVRELEAGGIQVMLVDVNAEG